MPVMAQQTFDLKNASKYFDVKVTVAECDIDSCHGNATFGFYKKGYKTPYQELNLPDTYIQLDSGKPLVNRTMLYDEQSVINIDDYNFDGMDDVAICNGNNGSYGGPSYNIYLSDRKQGKFVLNNALTELGSHLGMFNVDKAKKQLSTFDKSGCCYHITEDYTVVNNRPVKVRSVEEDATIADETKVKITTKTLVAGKWKTSIKYVKREQ